MLKILKLFQNIFKRYNVQDEYVDLPITIEDNEKIIRAIYSPINLHRKHKERLNNNFYKPPYDSNEVSVNRFDFTDAVFLKALAKQFQNPEHRRTYFGFVMLDADEIRANQLDIIYSPLTEPVINPFHADIIFEHTVKRGEQLPAEVSHQIRTKTRNQMTIIGMGIN